MALTFAQLMTGIQDNTIVPSDTNIIQATRDTYFTPYSSNTNYPYPVAYINIDNFNINLSNSLTTDTSFSGFDFTTATDWITLNSTDA